MRLYRMREDCHISILMHYYLPSVILLTGIFSYIRTSLHCLVEYKKHYTDEEINEVIGWMKSHFDELPESLHIDKATYISDFKKTVTLYYDIAIQHKDNPTYAAQIRHLFLMRDAVINLWKEQGRNIDDAKSAETSA